MITSGYELTTAITNIFIFVVSLYALINIKIDKKWKFFFFLMTIDSFLGVVAHGIVMSKTVYDLLWMLLSIIFTITINTMFCIFMKYKFKYIIYLSLLLSIPLIIQVIVDADYILTFVVYTIMIFILSMYSVYKHGDDTKKWFLIGFIVQFIGGILMLSRVKLVSLNHNGICHLFMVIALILFYIGIRKKEDILKAE